MPPGAEDQQQPLPPLQASQLPPPPDIPVLPRGASPPAAVIGVIGVPEIMRASTAAQQVEKTIGERREKLNEDAQKEQAAWRDMQQALANDRGKLSPEQVRSRERELQDRITKAQREFRERGTIIQQAAQYGLAQIERTLVGVIQKVAESRGMNLVLHRQQVALNVNEFDITEQVTEELNKVLPSVIIPPDGVTPAEMAKNANTSAEPAAAHPCRRAEEEVAVSEPPRRLSPARLRRARATRASSIGPARLRWATWPRRPAAPRPARALLLSGVAPLQSAGPDQVSFLDNRKYLPALRGHPCRRGDRASRHGGAGAGRLCSHHHRRALSRLGAGGGAVPSAAAASAGLPPQRRGRSRGPGGPERRNRPARGRAGGRRNRPALPHRPRAR